MFELLFAFAFWPWLLTIAFVGCLVLASTKELAIVALFANLAYSIMAWFLYNAGPLAWVFLEPFEALLATVFYAVIGALWSLFKWSKQLHLPTTKEVVRQHRERWLEEDKKNKVEDYANLDTDLLPSAVNPAAHKSRIVTWLSLWPLSVLGFLVADIILDFFNWLYQRLSGVYEAMTRNVLI